MQIREEMEISISGYGARLNVYLSVQTKQTLLLMLLLLMLLLENCQKMIGFPSYLFQYSSFFHVTHKVVSVLFLCRKKMSLKAFNNY